MEKLHPVWDGFYTILFTPPHTTSKGSHIRDAVDLKRTMFFVILALVPCLLFGIYNTGHQHYLAMGEYLEVMDGFGDKLLHGIIVVLPLVIISYGVGLGVEFLFCIVKGHQIQEGYLVSGLLIPLIMPAGVPLWMVIVAVVFAVIIGKEVFGGTGMNIVNIALTARAFLFFAYPTQMSGNEVWVAGLERDDEGKVKTEAIAHYDDDTADPYTYTGNVYAAGENGAIIGKVENGKVVDGIDGYTGATPLGNASDIVGMQKDIRSLQKTVDNSDADPADVTAAKMSIEALEKKQEAAVSKFPSVEEASVGFIRGSIGETSAIACLLGALFLIFTGVGSWRIMLSVVVGGFCMAAIFNAAAVNPFMELEPLLQLTLGGFMFGAVFMATDPVTATQTTTGKYIYGFFIGFFAIMIRVFNPAYPEGMMMAILFMNIMAPMIDHYVIGANIKRRKKRLKTA